MPSKATGTAAGLRSVTVYPGREAHNRLPRAVERTVSFTLFTLSLVIMCTTSRGAARPSPATGGTARLGTPLRAEAAHAAADLGKPFPRTAQLTAARERAAGIDQQLKHAATTGQRAQPTGRRGHARHRRHGRNAERGDGCARQLSPKQSARRPPGIRTAAIPGAEPAARSPPTTCTLTRARSPAMYPDCYLTAAYRNGAQMIVTTANVMDLRLKIRILSGHAIGITFQAPGSGEQALMTPQGGH